MTFYLGFSISAYQTEGNNYYSDWYYFEGEKLPKSGDACRLWERYEDLIPILKELHVNAFRFSIEWSRIFPEKDKVNYNNLRRYLKFTNLLLKNGIEPFIVLWHFTNPKWFFDMGGWENKDNIQYFLDYTDLIVKNFSKIGVKFFIPFNEPLVYIFSSYFLGIWPPFKRVKDISDFKKIAEILNNIHRAYKEAYKIIKENDSNCMYIESFSGISIPFLSRILPKDAPINFVLPTIPNKVEILGINYYGKVVNPRYRKYSISMSMFKKILELSSKKVNEIFITENGINTNDEYIRVRFIRKHLNFILENKEKYRVRGYFIWSLMDNYEWEIGYKAKFGILTRNLEPKDSYYEIKNLFSRLNPKDL